MESIIKLRPSYDTTTVLDSVVHHTNMLAPLSNVNHSPNGKIIREPVDMIPYETFNNNNNNNTIMNDWKYGEQQQHQHQHQHQQQQQQPQYQHIMPSYNSSLISMNNGIAIRTTDSNVIENNSVCSPPTHTLHAMQTYRQRQQRQQQQQQQQQTSLPPRLRPPPLLSSSINATSESGVRFIYCLMLLIFIRIILLIENDD